MDLSAWGSLTVADRLGGGHRNEVYRVRRGSEPLVARRSRRSVAALDWELDLIAHLSAHGFVVPEGGRGLAGRRHVDGVVVQRWLPGEEPAGADWQLVADELRRLHTVLAGWPQRPGFASTRDLLTIESGGDVDLTTMPADAVAACRAAWGALTGPPTVVHGDPCAPNVRIRDGRVGLLDWDESRVDHPWLDLADLPEPPLTATELALARAAIDAWEAANAWRLEPDYARRRLARLTDARG